MRAVEGLAIRLKEVDFSVIPTIINHIIGLPMKEK
jgi:hypothetical protein